uniref:Ribose-5-phosphate isomerase n=1 Tax=Zea mays TaxID=4577 RepID=A0A804U5X9_MAIZE
MEAMPRPSVAPSLQLQARPCPRWPRRKHCPPSSVASRRVACSASAADADVVDLFDAAKLTVDKFVTSGMVVGLGSGPASALAIQYLGTRLRRGSLAGITAVTSSVLSASEADKAGIRANSYQEGTQRSRRARWPQSSGGGRPRAESPLSWRRSQQPWRLSVQAMAKSAHKLAFITGNDKYVTTGVEGSIPVLIKSAIFRGTG